MFSFPALLLRSSSENRAAPSGSDAPETGLKQRAGAIQVSHAAAMPRSAPGFGNDAHPRQFARRPHRMKEWSARRSMTRPTRNPRLERRADVAARSPDSRSCCTRTSVSSPSGLCSPVPPSEALFFFVPKARGIAISQFCRLSTDYLVGLASALADSVATHFV